MSAGVTVILQLAVDRDVREERSPGKDDEFGLLVNEELAFRTGVIVGCIVYRLQPWNITD